MKRTIRLTESELNRLISESVKHELSRIFEDEADRLDRRTDRLNSKQAELDAMEQNATTDRQANRVNRKQARLDRKQARLQADKEAYNKKNAANKFIPFNNGNFDARKLPGGKILNKVANKLPGIPGLGK